MYFQALEIQNVDWSRERSNATLQFFLEDGNLFDFCIVDIFILGQIFGTLHNLSKIGYAVFLRDNEKQWIFYLLSKHWFLYFLVQFSLAFHQISKSISFTLCLLVMFISLFHCVMCFDKSQDNSRKEKGTVLAMM